jgi:SAM-dependent methyltransferase
MKKNKIILGLIFSSISLFGQSIIETELLKNFFFPEITTLDIQDWQNPTAEDYWKIHRFMKERHVANINTPISNRPFPDEFLNTDFYGWLLYRSGRIAISSDPLEMPKGRQIVYFNNNPEKKDKCVICYAGYQSHWNDRDYLHSINFIIESLKKFNFDGHFIYYIGGWPSLEKNRLQLADVPFSFKPFLFEEARDLGYENILWIDACCVPVKSLDPIFEFIKTKGLCFYSYRSISNRGKTQDGFSYLMPFLEISHNKQYEDISSQVVGINVKNNAAAHLLDEWIHAAEKKIPFLSSDEPPFMYLVNNLGLTDMRMPIDFYIETPCNTGNFSYWKSNNKAIIYHQYDFLNPIYEVPYDLFEH